MAQLGSALDWGSRGRRFKSCRPDTANKGGTRSSGAALAASTSGDARTRCLRREVRGPSAGSSADLRRRLSDYLSDYRAGRPRTSNYRDGRSPKMLSIAAAPSSGGGSRVDVEFAGERGDQGAIGPGRARCAP